MQASDGNGPFGIYRGWTILAAAIACAALAFGGSVYVFGLLVLPVSQEFDLSRAEMNTGFITLLVSMAFWGAVIGRLVDKYSVRIIMPLGGALITAGTLGIALAPSPATMLLSTFALLGPGVVAAGAITAGPAVSGWFRRRRGRAMGFLALASSIGGFIIPPLVALLIAHWGWRVALASLGLMAGPAIIAVSLALMRDHPPEQVLEQAGELTGFDGTAARPGHAVERTWPLGEMLRSREFWLVQIGVALLMGSDQALLSLKIPFYQSKGVSLEAASVLLAAQTASAILGKIAIGFLAERLDIRRIFAVICTMHITVLVCFIYWPGFWTMLVLLSFLGAAVGGVWPAQLVLIGTIFGSRSFGQALGAITLAVQFVSICFIFLSGKIFDRTGNYDAAFWLFLVGVAVSLVLVQMVRLPERQQRFG